jgi:hypothetical protein
VFTGTTISSSSHQHKGKVMDENLTPMDLSEIFEKVFSLFGTTVVRNLIIAVVFLLLPIILLVFATNDFYSSMAEINKLNSAGSSESGNIFFSMFPTLAYFLVALLFFVLGTTFAEIAIMIIAAGEIRGEEVSYTSAIVGTFDKKWLRVIGAGFLKVVAVMGLMIVFGIVAAVVSAVAGKGTVLTVLYFFGIAAALGVMVFIFVRWAFSSTAIAADDYQISDALGQSWTIVKGHWWRTAGILLLFSILTQFIITIVSLPFTFGSMWNVYKEFFTMLQETKGNISPQDLRSAQGSMGFGAGISSGISGLLTLLIQPLFMVVMYFDLVARRNKFEQTLSPTNETAQAPAGEQQ